MKTFTAIFTAFFLATAMVPATSFAGPDDRQDRRECRRDEGVVGQDKRECKQEEVRDGVRGNQGERLGQDDD